MTPVAAHRSSRQSDGQTSAGASAPLTPLAVVRHLRNRGLLGGASLTDGHLLVTEVSRRQINYRVTADDGTGYFVKHASTPDRMATLAREAAIYTILAADRRTDGLGGYLPRLLDYDPGTHVLVLELLPGAANLREYQLQRRRFSKRAARAMGRALGLLHDPVRSASMDRATREALADGPPGALSLHQPHVALLTETSAASLELIRLIQSSSDLVAELDRLRARWRCDVLIHRDAKWDNVVTHISARTSKARHPIIVDWELAGMGDPDWDTGSVFADYLNTWLLSIPMGGADPFDRYLEYARYPLETMRPAIRSFWDSYVHTRGLDRVAAHASLLRAIEYSAARLVQSAFEHSQVSYELGSGAAGAVQLSVNILRRPLEAGVHLLGVA
jgi:aminoglycoside phosphotransferase